MYLFSEKVDYNELPLDVLAHKRAKTKLRLTPGLLERVEKRIAERATSSQLPSPRKEEVFEWLAPWTRFWKGKRLNLYL